MKKLDLAELRKRMQVRTALAVSIESGRIVVDQVRSDAAPAEGKGFVLPIGADSIVADPEKAGQELAAHLEAAGIKEKRAVVCVPANWALTTTTDVPGVSEEDLRSYLELRAEREFPISVADLRLAHCAYVLPDGQQRATLAAIPVRRMEAVERMLAVADCRAVSLSLGLDRCLPEAESTALHFVANGNHVDLVIAAGGGIAAVRSLPAPGNEADHFDPRGFSREVRITLGRLPEGLRKQVREARFSGTPSTAEELYSEIRAQLSQMGIESRVQQPAGDASGHPGAALDAAQHHLLRKPVVFEFLPPQVNRWEELFHRFDSRRRRWIVGAVVGAIFLPILVFMVRSRMESSLNDEWNRMRRTVADLESLQQKIRTFRPWFDATPHSLQVLEAVVAAFPEQGDVWAKSLELGEAGKVTVTGFARNQGALIATLERLRARTEVSAVQVQQVRGENPVQFTVGFKWEGPNAK